jgi:hypothetical chaperone protein
MYGIDFGTSNTVVTADVGGGARLLELGEEGVVPSLLYYERDGRPSVGAEAASDYAAALGRFRGRTGLQDRFRFFQALKLALKDESFEGTRIFGEYKKAEALAALFLREVKRRADEATGRDEDTVVLGRPVCLAGDGASGGSASDARLQERFRRACALAGFSSVRFVLEPVAAAMNFLSDGGNVLVFDFGGGTLDISIARERNGDAQILASAGRDLGGYLLNEDLSRAKIIGHFGASGRFRTMTGKELEIPRWITDQVASFYALPLAELAKTRETIKDLVYDARAADKAKLRGLVAFIDGCLAFDLFRRIDEAKIELSSRSTAKIAYAVPPHVSFEEEIGRAEFESIIAPRVAEARGLVMAALDAAGLEPDSVSRVVRVGGSSRVPAFVSMLEALFPGRVEEGAVFTSIASGLIEADRRGLSAA